MSDLSYPNRIDRRAQEAYAQMKDYFSIHRDDPIDSIYDPKNIVDLEESALGPAAKLIYLNTIRNELRVIASGKRKPAAGLRHLDDLARAWVAKNKESSHHGGPGASMAQALSDQWESWVSGGPYAKERIGFVDHFGLSG